MTRADRGKGARVITRDAGWSRAPSMLRTGIRRVMGLILLGLLLVPAVRAQIPVEANRSADLTELSIADLEYLGRLFALLDLFAGKGPDEGAVIAFTRVTGPFGAPAPAHDILEEMGSAGLAITVPKRPDDALLSADPFAFRLSAIDLRAGPCVLGHTLTPEDVVAIFGPPRGPRSPLTPGLSDNDLDCLQDNLGGVYEDELYVRVMEDMGRTVRRFQQLQLQRETHEKSIQDEMCTFLRVC